jgi:hypothetical protein
MDKLIAGCIILVLVIITFLLLIFMPTPNCYFSFDEIGHEFAKFSTEENFQSLVTEIENSIYDKNNIRMLYQNGMLHENFVDHPKLYSLIRTVPNVERVFLKKVTKKSHSDKRKGSANTSNNTFRCVLPIDIPGAKKSGMWLDGESRLYRDMDWIIYDDSRTSTYYNNHKRCDLYLLVVDVTRPSNIPMGIAITNHNILF